MPHLILPQNVTYPSEMSDSLSYFCTVLFLYSHLPTFGPYPSNCSQSSVHYPLEWKKFAPQVPIKLTTLTLTYSFWFFISWRKIKSSTMCWGNSAGQVAFLEKDKWCFRSGTVLMWNIAYPTSPVVLLDLLSYSARTHLCFLCQHLHFLLLHNSPTPDKYLAVLAQCVKHWGVQFTEKRATWLWKQYTINC